MTVWIDTHCHLDAPEFGTEAAEVRARATAVGLAQCVIPAVEVANFDTVRTLARRFGDAYALGIHPLYVARAQEADLATLDVALERHRDDPRLVAVGEIGLDYFVPELKLSPLKERQEHFYREQLKLARRHGLPVILHVRRSADALLRRAARTRAACRAGAASRMRSMAAQQQAKAFIDLGFKLGFGGAVTYERALQLRRLAAELPLSALVLETDAPDIPPHWLYVTAEQRAAGQARQPNEPAELPRIGAVVAGLRGISVEALARATARNAGEALPGVMEGIS
jgi:TatD DNase family protein